VERSFRPRRGPVAEWPVGRIGVGHWRAGAAGGVAPEEVVAVRTAGGWEIHCHGGVAAPAAILDDLRAEGAVVVSAAAWTGTAGRDAATEALALFPAVRGPRAARILARQHAGLLDRAFDDLAALVGRGDHDAARSLASRLLAAGRIGVRLDRPWRVVVAGCVNAGKSSLVNALAGHTRSIVSPVPGTTRDAVETPIVVGGWEMVLVDTAGTPGDGTRIPGAVERAGVERAAEECRRADLVLRVVEAGTPPLPGDGIVVWSKLDLAQRAVLPAGVVGTSSATGVGIDDLAASLVRHLLPELVSDPTLLDGAVPFLERHLELVQRVAASVGGPSAVRIETGSGRPPRQ